ncbi:MAG: hypothetical protein KC434_19895 [Anaerolineales bacterium]|nr:hypothetical protein [Anaerolineales bacterium]
MKRVQILAGLVTAVLVFMLMGCGTANEATETAVSNAQPSSNDQIEISYTTPAQQEGPYYPVDKPADRDNDLLFKLFFG